MFFNLFPFPICWSDKEQKRPQTKRKEQRVPKCFPLEDIIVMDVYCRLKVYKCPSILCIITDKTSLVLYCVGNLFVSENNVSIPGRDTYKIPHKAKYHDKRDEKYQKY